MNKLDYVFLVVSVLWLLLVQIKKWWMACKIRSLLRTVFAEAEVNHETWELRLSENCERLGWYDPRGRIHLLVYDNTEKAIIKLQEEYKETISHILYSIIETRLDEALPSFGFKRKFWINNVFITPGELATKEVSTPYWEATIWPDELCPEHPDKDPKYLKVHKVGNNTLEVEYYKGNIQPHGCLMRIGMVEVCRRLSIAWALQEVNIFDEPPPPLRKRKWNRVRTVPAIDTLIEKCQRYSTINPELLSAILGRSNREEWNEGGYYEPILHLSWIKNYSLFVIPKVQFKELTMRWGWFFYLLVSLYLGYRLFQVAGM